MPATPVASNADPHAAAPWEVGPAAASPRVAAGFAPTKTPGVTVDGTQSTCGLAAHRLQGCLAQPGGEQDSWGTPNRVGADGRGFGINRPPRVDKLCPQSVAQAGALAWRGGSGGGFQGLVESGGNQVLLQVLQHGDKGLLSRAGTPEGAHGQETSLGRNPCEARRG